MRWAARAGWAVAAVLGAALLARLLGVERGAVPALTMALLPLLLALSYPLLLGAVLLRRRRLSAVALALAVAHGLLVAPATARSDRPCEGVPLRVAVANLLYSNPTPAEAGAAVAAQEADVVVLPELTRAGLPAVAAVGAPHSAAVPPRNQRSPGLLSRLPLRDVAVPVVGGRDWPRVTVDAGGVPVRVLAVHTLPPNTHGRQWQQSLRDLDDEVAALDGPVVVVGDFNADRAHASFRALLDDGVRDAHAERGRGLATTWPAGFPVLHLDHVLVRDGGGARVAVCDVREFAVPGSDHLGVVADLAVARG